MNILLSDDKSIFDGKGQAKHNQICIGSIEAMGIVIFETLMISSYKLHDFVLTLPRGI